MPHPFPNLPVPLGGDVHRLEVPSVALQGNYWSDPWKRELWVYTPPDYNETQRYPLVLFLSGFAGTGEAMLARSLTDISLARRCDRWIAEGCPPFVAAFPDCITTLGGSQYLDSPAIGNYATHVVEELIPFVLAHFSCSGRVGLAGRSSGGYGALRLGMEHPQAIHAIACHAGDMGFQTAFWGEITAALLPLHQAGSPRAFLDAFWRKRRFGSQDFAAFNLLCMSAAYSPNVHNEDFPADLPIDIEFGTVHPEVFDRWLQHDPLVLIEESAHQKALRSMDFVFLDVGASDEYLLQFGARKMVARLNEHQIDHTYEEFDGGHRGTAYRYRASIPKMIRALQ